MRERAALEKRERELVAQLERLEHVEVRAARPMTATGKRIAWCALPLAMLAMLPLGLAHRDGRDDVAWTETTCEVREIVSDDGESAGYVTTPALRPSWDVDAASAGRCWIPVPETSRRIALFEPPREIRVSRWSQIGYAPRALSASLIVLAAGMLISGRHWPRR